MRNIGVNFRERVFDVVKWCKVKVRVQGWVQDKNKQQFKFNICSKFRIRPKFLGHHLHPQLRCYHFSGKSGDGVIVSYHNIAM